MEQELGARLGKSIVHSTTTSAKKSTSYTVDSGVNKPDIPIERIVRDNILKIKDRELSLSRQTNKALMSSAAASIYTISNVKTELVDMIKKDSYIFQDITLRHCHSILQLTSLQSGDIARSTTITSLLQDVIEHRALVEGYKDKVEELRRDNTCKDILTRQFKSDVGGSGNTALLVPEIAIKVATLMESPKEDCTVLVPLLKNLVQNQGRNKGKRWNDEIKSLYAIILDYGGPALAKILKEKLGGPSLGTIYRTARCSYIIPHKLEKQMFERAASFYNTIGYTGVFSLAIDATAVVPLLKVKGNRLIGLASENDVVLKTAEDIINIVNDENSEKAKLANAFILTPLQEHVPPFILAISPVYKGQDYALVKEWFNLVLLWAGQKNMMVVGLGADGDSKVRKYYQNRFRRRREQREAAIDIN